MAAPWLASVTPVAPTPAPTTTHTHTNTAVACRFAAKTHEDTHHTVAGDPRDEPPTQLLDEDSLAQIRSHRGREVDNDCEQKCVAGFLVASQSRLERSGVEAHNKKHGMHSEKRVE
jgi:hypothetical protein